MKCRMKVSIILGTRPEIIKMSPIIRELEKKQADYIILHTSQHYSYNLDKVFFEQLKLPPAKYNLEVGSGSHAQETARILIGVENILQNESPDIVLVEGDTNSVLAAALAAAKLHIKVGLESNARLILTDSGGVQEESCILGVPCLTLRDNTERPETLEGGSNMLAGASPDKILECSQIMLDKENSWQNPFGDGKAGERIAQILQRAKI